MNKSRQIFLSFSDPPRFGRGAPAQGWKPCGSWYATAQFRIFDRIVERGGAQCRLLRRAHDGFAVTSGPSDSL